METKININSSPSASTHIQVIETTYKCNWNHERVSIDETEERTFNSVNELSEYVSNLTPINQRMYREARKKKLGYYLVKQIETK